MDLKLIQNIFKKFNNKPKMIEIYCKKNLFKKLIYYKVI